MEYYLENIKPASPYSADFISSWICGKFGEARDEISVPLRDNRKSPVHSKIPLDTTHEIFLPLLLLRSQPCCENRDGAPFRGRSELHGQVLLHFCLCNPTAVMKGKESNLVFGSNLKFYVWYLGMLFPHLLSDIKLIRFLCSQSRRNKNMMFFTGRHFRLKTLFKNNFLDSFSTYFSAQWTPLCPALNSSFLSGKSHCLWQYHCISIHISVDKYKHLYLTASSCLTWLVSFQAQTQILMLMCTGTQAWALRAIHSLCIRSKSPDVFFQRFARFPFVN